MTSMSAMRFNQDLGAAKRAAAEAPVFVTNRGTPEYVLLSIADYHRLTGRRANLLDDITPFDDDLDFEPGRFDELARGAAL